MNYSVTNSFWYCSLLMFASQASFAVSAARVEAEDTSSSREAQAETETVPTLADACQDKASKAVRYLRTDIRANAAIWSSISDCIRTAPFVETTCEHQNDRSDLLFKIFDDSGELWHVHCANLDPNVNGEAEVDIYGVDLDLDYDFVANNTIERIASVIAHETAHNLGYEHRLNPIISAYYPLTVPEQVEACVRTGGTANSPALSGFIERKNCCGDPQGFCNAVECFDMTDYTFLDDPTDGHRYWGNFFIQSDGSYLMGSENPDAYICAWVEVPSTAPFAPSAPSQR